MRLDKPFATSPAASPNPHPPQSAAAEPRGGRVAIVGLRRTDTAARRKLVDFLVGQREVMSYTP